MTRTGARWSVPRWLRTAWGCQRGVAATEILALAAVVLSGLTTGLVRLEGDFALKSKWEPTLNQCIKDVKAADRDINEQAKVKVNISDSDPSVTKIKNCRNLLTQFNNESTNKALARAVNGQTDFSVQAAGECWTSPETFPFGVIGESYRETFYVSWHGHPSGVTSGSVAVTGDVVGAGTFGEHPSVDIPAEASKSAKPGATSRVTATVYAPAVLPADGNGNCPGPPGCFAKAQGACIPLASCPTGCPAGLKPNAGGGCDYQCTTKPGTIPWVAPEPPEIVDFHVEPNEIEKGAVQQVTLVFDVKKVLTAAVNKDVGPVIGVDWLRTPRDLAFSRQISAPDQDTTWTLTATGSGGSAAKPVTTALKVKQPATTYQITLAAAATQVADTKVNVSGTVSPAPPAGTPIAIRVNGSLGAVASTDGGGNFAAPVPLSNTTPDGALQLNDTGRSAAACGALTSPVVRLSNTATAASVKNTITAVIGSGSLSSNVAGPIDVFHAVRITSAGVTWTKISGPCGNGAPVALSGVGTTVQAGGQASLGTYPCGIPCPGTGTHCSWSATVTVATTGGTPVRDSFWSVDID